MHKPEPRYDPVVNKSFMWQTTEPKYISVNKVLDEQYKPNNMVYPWPSVRIATTEQLKVLIDYYGEMKPIRLAKNQKIKGIEFHLSFPVDEWDQIAELLKQ